jgi:hypothetical protein
LWKVTFRTIDAQFQNHVCLLLDFWETRVGNQGTF